MKNKLSILLLTITLQGSVSRILASSASTKIITRALTSAITRWEYKILKVNLWYKFSGVEIKDPSELEAELNNLAKEGWELFKIDQTRIGSYGSRTSAIYYILRRPVTNE